MVTHAIAGPRTRPLVTCWVVLLAMACVPRSTDATSASSSGQHQRKPFWSSAAGASFVGVLELGPLERCVEQPACLLEGASARVTVVETVAGALAEGPHYLNWSVPSMFFDGGIPNFMAMEALGLTPPYRVAVNINPWPVNLDGGARYCGHPGSDVTHLIPEFDDDTQLLLDDGETAIRLLCVRNQSCRFASGNALCWSGEELLARLKAEPECSRTLSSGRAEAAAWPSSLFGSLRERHEPLTECYDPCAFTLTCGSSSGSQGVGSGGTSSSLPAPGSRVSASSR